MKLEYDTHSRTLTCYYDTGKVFATVIHTDTGYLVEVGDCKCEINEKQRRMLATMLTDTPQDGMYWDTNLRL